MAKKVLILSASPRKKSNSDAMAQAFMEGAEKAGHSVEKISLRDKTINFCKGCMACQKTKHCVQHDDAEGIAEKMRTADVICFATPIYYYAVSGQLKTMLDRSNPLYPAEYSFRDIYLLASSADKSPKAIEGAIKDIEGWVACFKKSRLAGVVHGAGVTNEDDIKNRPDIVQKSRSLGGQC
ncbi:MAG: flavodoxin family protein [Desulfovibrionaceae bacterium]|nr:flavodoxin family protein [Desulfovibrionaceae bacterium]